MNEIIDMASINGKIIEIGLENVAKVLGIYLFICLANGIINSIYGASVPRACLDNRGISLFFFLSLLCLLNGGYNSFASEIFLSVRTIQLRD